MNLQFISGQVVATLPGGYQVQYRAGNPQELLAQAGELEDRRPHTAARMRQVATAWQELLDRPKPARRKPAPKPDWMKP